MLFILFHNLKGYWYDHVWKCLLVYFELQNMQHLNSTNHCEVVQLSSTVLKQSMFAPQHLEAPVVPQPNPHLDLSDCCVLAHCVMVHWSDIVWTFLWSLVKPWAYPCQLLTVVFFWIRSLLPTLVLPCFWTHQTNQDHYLHAYSFKLKHIQSFICWAPSLAFQFFTLGSNSFFQTVNKVTHSFHQRKNKLCDPITIEQ